MLAAIAGPAIGGDAELAYACDFRIANTKARFGNLEAQLGILAAAGPLLSPAGTGWEPRVKEILSHQPKVARLQTSLRRPSREELCHGRNRSSRVVRRPVNDEFRGRNPDESTEQWLARSSVEYHDAWDAVRIQQRGRSPFLDDGYDGAMDRLQAADNERGNAAIALDRERRNIARAAGMQAKHRPASGK